MAEFDHDDLVRQALSGLAAGPDRPADAVLEDLRPALGRARLHHRIGAVAMSAAAVALVVIGSVAVLSPTDARPVEVGGETSDPVEVRPIPTPGERVSNTTVAPPTTLAPTTSTPPETAAAVVTTAPAPDPVDDRGPDTEGPAPSPEPTSPPPVVATSPPTIPAPPAPPATATTERVVIQVPGAGAITVGHTTTTITEVEVTTVPGSSYEIEDRTVHEVRVEFEGNRKVEVEIHLEDGEITYQIDGDDPDS